MTSSITLDMYGFRAEVRCGSAEVLANIRQDFAFFEREVDAEVVIQLFKEVPPYEQVPEAKAAVFTPRNVTYSAGGITFVDYSGRALGMHDRARGAFTLYSLDEDLLYEATYLFLLSQSGEYFDAHHLHRVHALGVSIGNRGALVLLPMGGGKSTLGSELLSYPEIQLLSDDSPLIDGKGEVFAFPLRLGLLPGAEGTIPEEQLRRIRRMEFGPKLLVNYSYFADRVRARAEPSVLFLGTRSLRDRCEIRRASKFEALKAMMANCVVGLGLFQGMEFVFQHGWAEIFRKSTAAVSRLWAAVALVRRAEAFHLVLGRNVQENGRAVVAMLREPPR